MICQEMFLSLHNTSKHHYLNLVDFFETNEVRVRSHGLTKNNYRKNVLSGNEI